MVTRLCSRSTSTDFTSGWALNVFSIPVAQNAQTMPLTVALMVSAETAAVNANMIASVSSCFFIFVLSSKLNGPVEHDVLVAAVADLQQVGFVEKAKQRRGDEVVVLRGMMIDLEHEPGV